MLSLKLKNRLKNLPTEPGVYFFKQGSKILYIGKATNLNDRVKSYFNQDLLKTRGPLIKKLIEVVDDISYEQTDSVLIALLKEAELIKQLKPTYNTKLKDDKSYWSVIITKEAYPAVLMVRTKDLILKLDPSLIKCQFGPFPQAQELKIALKIIRRIFPFRDKCKPLSNKLCFSAQIGLCPGVCAGTITEAEYRQTIKHLKLFFQGQKTALVKELEKKMKQEAKKQNFEQASKIKKQIFALNHINDIALLKSEPKLTQGLFKIEAYDVAHLSGQNIVGVMTVLINNEPDKNLYRKFKLEESLAGNDILSLQELLDRRLGHPEWSYPNLIVVDGGKAQLRLAEARLKSVGLNIPVVAVVKNDKHQAREILGQKLLTREYETGILLANYEAHRFAIAYYRNHKRRLLQ